MLPPAVSFFLSLAVVLLVMEAGVAVSVVEVDL